MVARRRLAGVLVRPHDPTSGAIDGTVISTVRSDGTHLRAITSPSLFAGEVDWSPSGKRLVFDTHPLIVFNFDDVISNLYTSRPDGTDARQLTFATTSQDRGETQPRWTPNGRILYTRVIDTHDRTLWTPITDRIPTHAHRAREPAHTRRSATHDRSFSPSTRRPGVSPLENFAGPAPDRRPRQTAPGYRERDAGGDMQWPVSGLARRRSHNLGVRRRPACVSRPGHRLCRAPLPPSLGNAGHTASPGGTQLSACNQAAPPGWIGDKRRAVGMCSRKDTGRPMRGPDLGHVWWMGRPSWRSVQRSQVERPGEKDHRQEGRSLGSNMKRQDLLDGLSKADSVLDEKTKQVSSVVRQLPFAGLAFVWLLVAGLGQPKSYSISAWSVFSLLVFALAVALDAAQYVATSASWLKLRRRLQAELDGLPSDPNAESPSSKADLNRGTNKWPWILFFAKVPVAGAG